MIKQLGIFDSVKKRIQIHGHRGFRGKFPENTIKAFTEAMKAGAEFLEMDVVISADKNVVVSHEPWMNEVFCVDPNGTTIQAGAAEKFNLYQMTYSEISKFDCGVKINPEFPLQQSFSSTKPLLADVIVKVDEFTVTNNLPAAKFNIEIKSDFSGDNLFHPEPSEFVQLVHAVLIEKKVLSRVMLQSFDVRILQEIKRNYPGMIISFLVENNKTLEENLLELGFTPDIYGPEFILINDEMINALKEKNIKLIPWTVNDEKEMRRLISKGVDGLITDFPDMAKKVLSSMLND